MRIVYIIHNLNIGGAENLVTNYLIELKKMGNEVFCVQFNDSKSFLNKRLEDNKIPILTIIGKSSKNYFLKLKNFVIKQFFVNKKLNKMIKDIKPDVIHFHTYYPNIDKIKYDYNHIYFTFHTTVERSLKFANKKFHRHFLNACAKGMNVVAISEEILKQCKHYFPTIKVKLIHNGVDIKTIQKLKQEKNIFKSQIGLNTDSFVVGHVGRFNPVKNHEKIVEVFYKIHERRSDSKLVLVGGGDAQRISVIKKLVSDKGLKDDVLFLGDRDDATSIMTTFDAFVFPSKAEGFPLVALEAQALNIRSILSDVVPNDIVVNNNVFSLSINETSDAWANLVLNNSVNDTVPLDIMKFDISNIVKEHEMYYMENFK